MIAETVKEETRAVLSAIDAAPMEADRKSALRRIVVRAEEGTNGLTPEAKLQTVSESVFDLCLLQAFDMIDAAKEGRGRAGLYRLIERTRWQIVAIVGIVAALVAFHPEIVNVIRFCMGDG